ncbi:putative toxin, partial [Flavobacterium sp. NRK F10]|uniref:putative toxin n=1 Tax=Flavobacterium sp. NRK F10 TaxID=2954931 RepID=UPI0020906A8F
YVNVTETCGFLSSCGFAYNYVFNYTDHLGNIRLSYGIDPATSTLKIMEENHYYPFGLKHANYNSDELLYQKGTAGAVVLKGPTTTVESVYKFKFNGFELQDELGLNQKPFLEKSNHETRENGRFLEVKTYQYKYQGQERQDELGLNWDSFKWRNYDYAIGRFMSIDPLAEDYTYNSPYAFAENKLGMGRELEGCELGPFWNPLVGVMLSETSKPAIVENTMLKPAVETSVETSKFSESTLENFSRGRATEVEQLAENNLEKNTESFTRIDPKTGKEGTTIPDAMTPEGATVEVKNVQKQSLTRQLRLQREISNENGVKPELIINKDAKLSEPLQNGGFDIKTYEAITPVIESTGVKKPDLPRRVNTPSTTTPKPKVIVVIQSS